MIKRVVLLGRPVHVDAEDFGRQWTGQRVPAVAALPGVCRMVCHRVQSRASRDHLPASGPVLDGVEEIWFRSAGAAQCADPYLVRADLGMDVATPIGTLDVYAAQEHVIFTRPLPWQPLQGRLSLLTRRNGMSRYDFHRYWRTVHAPLAACHQHVVRYVQHHVVPVQTRNPPQGSGWEIDGMGEFLIADLQGMQADYQSKAGRRMNEDARTFIRFVSSYFVESRDVLS